MTTSQKTPDGPLASAALAIETELAGFERTLQELEAIGLTSEKTLQRGGRVLEACAAHEEKLARLLPVFAAAMQQVQERQQACMDLTATATERLKQRYQERLTLMQQLADVGRSAEKVNAPLAALAAEGERPASALLATLGEVGQQLAGIIDQADALLGTARGSNWHDVTRDAETLKTQLQAARNQVLLVQRNVS